MRLRDLTSSLRHGSTTLCRYASQSFVDMVQSFHDKRSSLDCLSGKSRMLNMNAFVCAVVCLFLTKLLLRRWMPSSGAFGRTFTNPAVIMWCSFDSHAVRRRHTKTLDAWASSNSSSPTPPGERCLLERLQKWLRAVP